MAMVIEDFDAVTMAVMPDMRGTMMMYMMMALKDIDRWNFVFSAGNAPSLRIQPRRGWTPDAGLFKKTSVDVHQNTQNEITGSPESRSASTCLNVKRIILGRVYESQQVHAWSWK